MSLPRLRTVIRTVQRISNWPHAVRLRVGGVTAERAVLRFRDGTRVVCRRDAGDWDVVRELFIRDCYGSAVNYLQEVSNPGYVLDLGANIGCFSLLAARSNPGLYVEAYEPGPQNLDVLAENIRANPGISSRIRWHAEAVGGTSRLAHWHFDGRNAGGSSLFGSAGVTHDVQVRAFADVVRELPGPIALVKIDIEGAEYELIRDTPAELWKLVPALVIEIHQDPAGLQSVEALRQQLVQLGFVLRDESTFATLFVRAHAAVR